MKSLLASCMIVVASMAWAGDATVKGVVLEVRDVDSYTYLRLQTKDGETWAAVSKAPVKKGAEVTIGDATEMRNFESKSLKKTFDKIIFGSLGGSAAGAMSPHAGMGKSAPDVGDVNVPKASGANARTVAEIAGKAGELKDKPVLVRGKVVKYNPGIMGKNWIHLRDGSGSAADNTNDILVTSANEARLGDVVTAKGVVRTDKDFGAGYVYKVLVEDATLQP
jgi:hypothetical protein